jgi:pimeloyl-ACP methyl ester carboxylesterase
MADPQYNGRPAKIEVHRVQPVYAKGRCEPNRVAVLVAGRTNAAKVSFDLRHDHGGELSVQEGLAWAGIDTFAPDMLGYGRSTRFGMDDPCNASRPDDTTNNAGIFPLDQQGRATPPTLAVNPLAGQRCAHSSSVRFGNTDLWVRDIARGIDDAIARGQPSDGKVTLIGYSFGAQRVGRALDPERHDLYQKVNKVIFGAPLFLGAFGARQPRDEPCDARERTCLPGEPRATWASFPVTVSGFFPFAMPQPREQACAGHVVPGSDQEFWEQSLAVDEIGSGWGGDVPGAPSGVIRSPTFSTYGFNQDVAALFSLPTLVMQGLDDSGLPPGQPGYANSCALYNALPAALANKVLVHLDCATHVFLLEGCTADNPRCQGRPGITPYGGSEGEGWHGAHSTFVAAAAEWIKDGTFTVPGQAPATQGKFRIDNTGLAHVQGDADGTPVTCP